MIIELLKNNNIKFIEHTRMDKAEITKISSEWNIVTIYSNSNTFTIKRDLFYYIDKLDEKYAFCLINKKEEKIYYMEFKNKNNWLKSSFDSCKKDELYFGKIVLQNKVTTNSLIAKIKKY